jgi:hypothetical protein
MTWGSVAGSTVYYILLPILILWRLILILISPVLHLIAHIFYILLLPARFLARFETLYIYIGIATLIGLLSGIILHYTSRIIISFFNPQSLLPEKKQQDEKLETGRTAASVRAARENQRLEEAWQGSTATNLREAGIEAQRVLEMKRDYAKYLESDRGRRKEGHSTISETILEEDDSDGFS